MTGVIESQSEVKTILDSKLLWKAYCYISI